MPTTPVFDSLPLAVASSYLLGAVPFGFVLARLRGIDLRRVGSGNIGATNAMRALGKPLGALAFFLDFAKGAVPVLLFAGVEPAHQVACGAAAVIGHVWPVYLRFKGGKAVATSFGAITAIDAWVALGGLAAWITVLYVTRYVSAASIGMASGFVLAALVRAGLGAGDPVFVGATVALFALILVRHRSNMARIRSGAEPKTKLFAPKRDLAGSEAE